MGVNANTARVAMLFWAIALGGSALATSTGHPAGAREYGDQRPARLAVSESRRATPDSGTSPGALMKHRPVNPGQTRL